MTNVTSLIEDWERYRDLIPEVYERGKRILQFVHNLAPEGVFQAKLPVIEPSLDNPSPLFAEKLERSHVFAALSGASLEHIITDAYGRADLQMDMNTFLRRMLTPSMDRYYVALTMQVALRGRPGGSSPLQPHKTGLEQLNLSPEFEVSHHEAHDFEPSRLFLDCMGSFKFDSDIGAWSYFFTVVSGRKIFVSWPPTARNLELYSAHHYAASDPASMLSTMEELESPRVNVLVSGQTVYIPAGYLYITFSPEASIVHRFSMVNPTSQEWEGVQRMLSFKESQVDRLRQIKPFYAHDLLMHWHHHLAGWEQTVRWLPQDYLVNGIGKTDYTNDLDERRAAVVRAKREYLDDPLTWMGWGDVEVSDDETSEEDSSSEALQHERSPE